MTAVSGTPNLVPTRKLAGRVGPLSGIVVVEVGGVVGEYAGRLLGEMGALVIKVESRQGSPSRLTGPFAVGAGWHKASLSFAALNVTKLSIALDLDSQDGLDLLRRLVGRADVVLESQDDIRLLDGQLAARLEAWNAKAIHCLVSPFGEESPWAGGLWSELTAVALGGIAGVCGYDDDPSGIPWPIAPVGLHSRYAGGVLAVIGVIAELLERHTAQAGARSVEVALHDALAVSTEGAVPSWEFSHEEVHRHTGRHAGATDSPVWTVLCGDGKYLCALPLSMNDRRFAELLDWLGSEGSEGDLCDPRFRDAATRDAEMPHIMDVVGKFCLKRNSQEIFLEAQRRRLPWAPINTAAELLSDPHLIDRGFFVEADSALYGKVTYPGVAFKGMPAVYETEGLDFCPPELGQDARAVLEWLGLSEDQIRSLILAESI